MNKQKKLKKKLTVMARGKNCLITYSKSVKLVLKQGISDLFLNKEYRKKITAVVESFLSKFS